MRPRTFVICSGIVAIGLPVVAQVDWTAGASVQKTVDLSAIERIEKVWHRS
jgi:hypothetical protein